MFKHFKKQNRFPNDNNGIVEVIRTDNKHIVDQINNSHREGVSLAEKQAKQDATSNLPPLKGTAKLFLKFLLAFYNKMVTQMKAEIQSNHHTYSANKEIEEFNQEKGKWLKKLNEVRSNLRISKHSFDDLKSCLLVMKNARKAQVIVVLLTMAELILSATSFQIIATNMLFSLILGIVFAGALYASAILGAKLLRKANNKIQFVIYLSVIILILGTLFWSLGQLRMGYLTEMSETGEINEYLSPFAFGFFQIFIFLTAIMIKYHYMPTKEEDEQYHTWLEAKKNIKKLGKQEIQLENDIKTIEVKLRRSLIARKTLISFVSDLEKKIDSMYKEAGHHYIKHNMHRRSDAKQGIPELFELDNALEDLTLYFQDEEALLTFNETNFNNE